MIINWQEMGITFGALIGGGTIWYQVVWKRMWSPARKTVSEFMVAWKGLLEDVKWAKGEIQKLVVDSQNNDGSTSRDRGELLYAEIKVLGDIISATSQVPTWRGIIDSKGRLVPVGVSDAFVKLTGMSHEQTRNDNWLNFVNTPDSVRVMETYRNAVERGLPFRIPYKLCHIGTERVNDIVHYGSPTRNTITNKIVGWVWEFYDNSADTPHRHRRATDRPQLLDHDTGP